MPFFRGSSTDHVFHFVGSRIRHQGVGASFFYFRVNSTIALVPVNVQDASFVFPETSSDAQTVTVQGQFSFRFTAPEKAIRLLNLTINPRTGAYLKNDLELLSQRLANAVRASASSEIQSRTLETNLINFQELGNLILERVRNNPVLEQVGIEIISLFILQVKPIPEISKALEAEYRERLLRQADEAIYARRAASIDEERTIKEKEAASQLALERAKEALIRITGENMLLESENKGKALEADSKYRNEQLERELEIWKGVDPALITALGFRLMGIKGATNLTITTEVLSAMLGQSKE